MNHWLDASAKNLLPLSKSVDFKEALGEWFFTGDVDDYEGQEVDILCELCEHPDLAHHYHIKNAHTEHSLLVGSSCILKFQQIEIRDKHGKSILDPSLRKSALDSALKAKLIDTALEPLRRFWKQAKHSRLRIERFAREVKEDNGLDPRDLLDLLSDLQKHQIPFQVRLYKVNLRSDLAKYQISRMSAEDFSRIEQALSKAQLARVRELRR